MNCKAFAAWLDESMPQPAMREALAHAETCARCTRELAAMRALEATFAAPSPVLAPAGFADGVMRRVADAAVARRDVPVQTTAMPWWATVAAQPATALACVLAGLLLWRGNAVAVAATAVISQLSIGLTKASASTLPAGSIWSSLPLQLGLAFALLPALGWMSWRLYAWSEQVVIRRSAAL